MAWLLTGKERIQALLGKHERITELESIGVTPNLYVRIGDVRQTRSGGADQLHVMLMIYFGEQHYLSGQKPLADVVTFGPEPVEVSEPFIHPVTGEEIVPAVFRPSFSQVMAMAAEYQVTTGAELLAANKAFLYSVFNSFNPTLREAPQV